MQIEEGVDDPDFIRDVYKESASGQSSLEALNRGLKDLKVMLAFLDPQTRRERDQRMRSSKNVIIDAPKMPLRRSITEILLNGSEMQGRGIITPPK